MKGALEADQERWRHVGHDIRQAIEAANQGLDDVFSCSQNDLTFTCSVAVAVSSLGAIAFTGGAAAGAIAAVGAAGVTGSAGIAANKVLNEPGGTTEQVVTSMENVIKRITDETKNAGSEIARALSDVHGHAQGAGEDFVSPRPALADVEGVEATSESGLGRVV